MSLREADPWRGAPWGLPLAGSLDQLWVESELLASNPLGDPPVRPLWVYTPPASTSGSELPVVYLIQGYFGQVTSWASRNPFEPATFERVDALFAAGECPPAVVVYVDAWTGYGGSQFLDSPAVGAYQSYLCDEVVPFVEDRYPVSKDPAMRAICGKSSGGYGAMVVPMMRPDVFAGGLASIAGDALFECSVLPGFREAARLLSDKFDGSYEVFLDHVAEAERFEMGRWGETLMTFGYAAAYSPDPAAPRGVAIPFDPATGRLVEEVWQRWLERDPVRMIASHADRLLALRHIHIESGTSDEWFMDLGARAVSRELELIGAEHTLDLFDGKHGGISHRYPIAIGALAEALGG